MNHRRSGTQKYFEFALWAGRRRTTPSPREVAAYFNVHIDSARRLRQSWLNARSAVAIASAQACAERIDTDPHREPSEPSVSQP